MIMDEASVYVNNRLIGEDEDPYNPTWVLIGQWDRVHPHPHGSDNHEDIDESYLDRVSHSGTLLILTPLPLRQFKIIDDLVYRFFLLV